MADHRDPAGGPGLRRGLAVPCFADDPADLVQLGIGAERAGFDGYFLWDHSSTKGWTSWRDYGWRAPAPGQAGWTP